jgi:NAD(P)H-dependent FMN reductase
MKLALLCGSLRGASLNRAALDALARRAPEGARTQHLRLDDLPLFNPDEERPDAPERLPVSVRRLRAQVSEADALVLAAPEYAHGVSSVAKTALDWLVGESACSGARTMLVNASPRAGHAQAQMREILATMSFAVIEEASLALPLLGRSWTAEEILARPDFVERIDAALDALSRAVKGSPAKPV